MKINFLRNTDEKCNIIYIITQIQYKISDWILDSINIFLSKFKLLVSEVIFVYCSKLYRLCKGRLYYC